MTERNPETADADEEPPSTRRRASHTEKKGCGVILHPEAPPLSCRGLMAGASSMTKWSSQLHLQQPKTDRISRTVYSRPMCWFQWKGLTSVLRPEALTVATHGTNPLAHRKGDWTALLACQSAQGREPVVPLFSGRVPAAGP
ncbi:hypothetical protein ACJZ2D_003471 [Fusarium nematophilum]